MPKKKRGRPPLPKSKLRKKQVKISLTGKEIADVRRAFKASGYPTMGKWLRELLLGAATQ